MSTRSTTQAGSLLNAATWGGTLPNATDNLQLHHACTLNGSITAAEIIIYSSGSISTSGASSITATIYTDNGAGHVGDAITIVSGTLTIAGQIHGGLGDAHIIRVNANTILYLNSTLWAGDGTAGNTASPGGDGYWSPDYSSDGGVGGNGDAGVHGINGIQLFGSAYIYAGVVDGSGAAGGNGGNGGSGGQAVDGGEGYGTRYTGAGGNGGNGGNGGAGGTAIVFQGGGCLYYAGDLTSASSAATSGASGSNGSDGASGTSNGSDPVAGGIGGTGGSGGAAGNSISGHALTVSIFGTFVVPLASNVSGNYALPGNVGTIDLTNLSSDNVRDTVVINGVTGNFTHTANYVAKTDVVPANQVLDSIPRWVGATGADVGTLTPSADLSEYTSLDSITLPPVRTVLITVPVYGYPGNVLSGALDVPSNETPSILSNTYAVTNISNQPVSVIYHDNVGSKLIIPGNSVVLEMDKVDIGQIANLRRNDILRVQ